MKEPKDKLVDYTLFSNYLRIFSDMANEILKSAEYKYDKSDRRFRFINSGDKLFDREVMIIVSEETHKQVQNDTYTNPIIFVNKGKKIRADLLSTSILNYFVYRISVLSKKTIDEAIKYVISNDLRKLFEESAESDGRIEIDGRSLGYVDDILKTGTLKLEIDLSATSKDQIEKEFRILLHNIYFLREIAEILGRDIFKKGRKSKAKDEDLWDLKYRAWELKRNGKTYDEIAEILNPEISTVTELDKKKASMKKYVKEMNILKKRIESRLHKIFQESQTK